MFSRRKKQLVFVSELEKEERDQLSDFLRLTFRDYVSLSGDKVVIGSEDLQLEDLARLVSKFVYHRNLNRKYWVKADGSSVRIGRFEKARKREKRRREATRPQTITHGW